MPITDAQYEAWLTGSGNNRIALIELSAFTNYGVKIIGVSNGVYVTKSTETPANFIYEDCVLEVPSFTRKLSEVFTGRSTQSFGEVVVSNANGIRDDWLQMMWDGRPCKMFLGDPGWGRTDFRQILSGTIDSVYAPSSDRIAFRIKDNHALLNRKTKHTIISSGPNAGKSLPVSYNRPFNVDPVLLDATLHKYAIADWTVNNGLNPRDNGVAVAYTASSPVDGTFVLTAAPSGQITSDVSVVSSGDPGAYSASRIISGLIDRDTFYASSGFVVSTASADAMAALAPTALSIYIKEPVNLIRVIDELITSIGGWYSFNRSGQMIFGRLDLPGSTYTKEIIKDDMAAKSFKLDRVIPPAHRVTIKYNRNWTPQKSGLAGSVTEANRALYGNESMETSADNTTNHLLSTHLIVDSLIGGNDLLSADATTERDRLKALYAKPSGIYRFEVYTWGVLLNLGDTVKITHPRYGFANGKTAVIVGLTEKNIGRNGRVEVEVFCPMESLSPGSAAVSGNYVYI